MRRRASMGPGQSTGFFSITIPMTSPAIFFSLVINMISSFGGVALLDRGTVLQPESFPDGILHCFSNVFSHEPGICQCVGLDHVHCGYGYYGASCSAQPVIGFISLRKATMKKSKNPFRRQSSTLTLRTWEFTGTALLTLFIWLFLLVFLSPLSYMVVTSLGLQMNSVTGQHRFIRLSA